MATQGMVVLTANGEVVRKIVVGCDGYKASVVAEKIRRAPTLDPETLEIVCIDSLFGCHDCRVIQTGPDSHYPPTTEIPDAVEHLYRDKFNDPTFNPRWGRGTVEYVEIVEIPNQKHE